MNEMRLEPCIIKAPPSYEFPPGIPNRNQAPPRPSKPLPPIGLPSVESGAVASPPRHFEIEATVLKGLAEFLPAPAESANASGSSVSGTSGSASASSTWSMATTNQQFLQESKSKASALLDSHDRFKPERIQRHPVQKVKWTQSRLARSLAGDLFSSSAPMTSIEAKYPGMTSYARPSHLNNNHFTTRNFLSEHLPLESESGVSSMTIADVSPRLAVKKVLLLYEHAQYREAANFIQRLSVGTFRIILRELPLDLLIEAMPHSLPILEALYSKVFTSDGVRMDLKPLKPECTVLHMVKCFSQEEMWRECRQQGKEIIGPFTLGCKRILRIILLGDPKVVKSLQGRRRALDKAVEGMGQHGLVGTTDESLLPLHDALKLDFRRVMDAYKGALQKLEDLSLSSTRNNPKNVSHGPAPIQASHQRQLSLRAEEIQERLIKNKSLLNVVEPTLGNHCLDILLGILQRRIDCDKDALFHFTQLRKEVGDVSSETLVAPLLMRYSRAAKKVLELMKEVGEEGDESLSCHGDDSSDLSGYHSDSDSAIMTSGNSPFVSPRARFNFLSRSVRCKTLLRPSLAVSNASSASPGIGSSADSGSQTVSRDLNQSPSNPSTNPIRPRTVKQRNQLHKNNSLVSSSSGDSELSAGRSGRSSDDFPMNPAALDYVTVVTVPENEVISSGTHGKLPPASALPPIDNRVTELTNEINQLRQNLLTANIRIKHLTDKDKRLEEPSGNGKEERRTLCIRQYGALYATTRVETMDALDAIPELRSADELKSKLLFSVVVLSFRSVESIVGETMKRVELLLQMDSHGRHSEIRSNKGCLKSSMSLSQSHTTIAPPPKDEERESEVRVREAIGDYLGNSGQNSSLNRAVEQVANQLWSTLYDYPCLKSCHGLLKYIRACVTLAWGLSTLTPPCRLEYETRVFRREMHVRFHSANPASDQIKSYLWPVLVQGPGPHCLHKGIVIT